MNYLIANWKASMTKSHLISWIETYFKNYDAEKLDIPLKEIQTEIILCPPYPLIPILKQHCKPYASVKIGSQHISPIQQGAYTGEVTAEVLQEYVEYSIVGHSERRKYFQLSEHDIERSLDQCTTHSIRPILCIRNEQDSLYHNHIIAYEPVEAIGSGKNARPEDVVSMKQSLTLTPDTTFLYGGSTDETNMKEYLATTQIDGFLVGTSSLNPQTFFQMTKVMLDR